MTALDVGCGPGFFTIPMAKLVGKNGKVIAADLQDGMLKKLQQKIQGTGLEKIIRLHKCEQDKIGIKEKVDFILAFYMVHEVPNKENFLKELKSLLNIDGVILIVEPMFHVTKPAFKEMKRKAESFALQPLKCKKLFFCRTVLFKN